MARRAAEARVNTAVRNAVPLGLAAVLALLSMISPFSIDTFFPSFRAMQAEFRLSDLSIQQTLTAYMLPYAVMSLVHGPMSDAFGRRVIVLWGLSLYALASLACAFAPTFYALLAFRALQGMTAGTGLTVGRAIIRDLYDGPEAQRLMSAVTMIFSVAPAIAPLIGGWIHVAFGWRAVFGFLAALGVAVVLASWVKLPETLPPQRRTAASFGGLAALSWRIMRTREFVMLALAGGLNFGAVLAYVGSAPAIVLDNWKLTETQFHWLFIPVIGGFTLGALLSGRMAGRLSQSRQVALGFATTIGTSGLAALLHATLASPPPIPLQQLLLATSSIGVQLVFPVLTLRVLDMFPANRGSAASVQTFIQLLVASAIIGFVAPAIHGSMLWLTFGSMVAATVAVFLYFGAARFGGARPRVVA